MPAGGYGGMLGPYTRPRTVPANGSSPTFTVTWSLTKTCTKGGTVC
jgi:hypothetical protein